MTQTRPVGAVPAIDVLFVGALLYCPTPDVAAVLELVADDDIESIALATVLGAVRRLATAGKPCGPQLVLAELQRSGDLRHHNGVADALREAITSGADPNAAPSYADPVVSGAMRRRLDSAGAALQAAAREASEDELSSLVSILSRSLGDCGTRLARLRGES